MTYVIVGVIFVFDFVILKIASKCSRVEEKMYLENYKRSID